MTGISTLKRPKQIMHFFNSTVRERNNVRQSPNLGFRNYLNVLGPIQSPMFCIEQLPSLTS